MNNKNFENLNNIEVPQSWIENAINIPNVVPKKKPLVFPRINRYLAAVACLVLVCTVSLVIVLNIDRNIVPVKPIVSDKNKGDNNQTEPTNEGIVPPTVPDNSNEPSTEPTSEPTNSEGDIIPTEKPTEGTDTEPTEPTESTDPSDKPSQVPPEPTEAPEPSAPPTETPVYPPTSPPSVEPTDEPTDEPTEAPVYPPTSPPWDDPTDEPQVPGFEGESPLYPSSGNPPSGSNVLVQIDVSKIPGYTTSGEIRLYCKVYDPDNKVLGSYDKFDPKNLVTIYKLKNGVAYGAYSIVNNYNLTKHGRYTARFYNQNGIQVATSYYNY